MIMIQDDNGVDEMMTEDDVSEDGMMMITIKILTIISEACNHSKRSAWVGSYCCHRQSCHELSVLRALLCREPNCSPAAQAHQNQACQLCCHNDAPHRSNAKPNWQYIIIFHLSKLTKPSYCWRDISGETAGDIWYCSLLGVKVLILQFVAIHFCLQICGCDKSLSNIGNSVRILLRAVKRHWWLVELYIHCSSVRGRLRMSYFSVGFTHHRVCRLPCEHSPTRCTPSV